MDDCNILKGSMVERKYEAGLVSVIMPVYNAARFLPAALDSVLCQTCKNIEIVLVNDCSTDNSEEIIRRYQQEHSNIVYHLQEYNQGAGAARNKALEIASGQFVAFLDSDDAWYPDKIDRQLALMSEKGSPFGYAAIEMVDEAGNQVKGKREIKEECDYKYLLRNTIIATSSVVIDRSVLGDFRMPLRRGGQDYATWLMLLRKGVVACGINEALVKYRLVNGSLSSNKLKSIKQVWEIQRESGVGICSAVCNVLCFVINALHKYLT